MLVQLVLTPFAGVERAGHVTTTEKRDWIRTQFIMSLCETGVNVFVNACFVFQLYLFLL